MSPNFQRISFMLSLLAVLLLGAGLPREGELRADEKDDKQKAKSQRQELADAEKRFSSLTPPKGSDSKALARFIAEVKLNRPRSYAEFVVLRRKIKSAAESILKLEKDKKSETYKDALGDAMEAAAALITLADAKTQKKEYEQFRDKMSRIADPGMPDVLLAVSVARSLENSESYTLAEQALRDFSELFSGHERTRNYAGLFKASLKRVRLVGQRMDVQGDQLDGSSFDIKSLKGKVVLVDFWATNCATCVAEYPALKKLYTQYKDKGFEIVGISLDEQIKPLKTYVKERQVPWIVLHDKESLSQDDVNDQYGVSTIPAMFLVGRQGKVISLNARGGRLAELLKRELGE